MGHVSEQRVEHPEALADCEFRIDRVFVWPPITSLCAQHGLATNKFINVPSPVAIGIRPVSAGSCRVITGAWSTQHECRAFTTVNESPTCCVYRRDTDQRDCAQL